MNARVCGRRTTRRYAWLALLSGAVLAKAAEDIRDIRGPKAVPGPWVLPAVLAGAIVAALCAYVVWRRRHRGIRRRTLTLSERTLQRLDAS
jgi:hypothetical protein